MSETRSPEDADLHARALAVLTAALARPSSERRAYLAEACGDDVALLAEARSLLEHDEASQGIEPGEGARVLKAMLGRAPVPSPPAARDEPGPTEERAGDWIGPYRLLQEIGEGGFGSVWLAEQREPVRRRVALKMIKLGMDTKQVIARFEAERQALALMDHLHIAKVFDAGSTAAGRPYFVMEYIRGLPILDYCDRERLDTRARLELCRSVALAIQHAHQKGIIHRDIKPSNVLVTMHDGVPVPKVIDFGIAKATNAELTQKTLFTEHHQLIGTPAYMSPEQAEMSGLDVDARCDVYSLGVLMYELLTGSTPFTTADLSEAGFMEMLRIIREEPPVKPSTRVSSLGATGTSTAQQRRSDPQHLRSALRGDLDWIVMKCLEKDRTRRYGTANELAADIARHLADEPVLAGPPSASYRARKFVRRHRVGVLAGVAAALLLIAGLVGTTYGLLEARAAEGREAERADELERVAAFQSQQIASIEPASMGTRLRDSIVAEAPEDRREELEAALGSVNFTSVALDALRANVFEPTRTAIDEQFADQPLLRAQLLESLARELYTFAFLELALEVQADVVAIRREVLGDDHRVTLQAINDMGGVLHLLGRQEEAATSFRKALEGGRRVLGDDDPDTFLWLNNLGSALELEGKLTEAERTFLQAYEGQRRVLGDLHRNTLLSLHNLGWALEGQGHAGEAEERYTEALEGWLASLGPDAPETLRTVGSLAHLLGEQGRTEEAEAYGRQHLEGCRRTLGDRHPETLRSMNELGIQALASGDLVQAEELFREVLDARRSVLGDAHPDTLVSVSNLASVRQRQGRFEEAESYFHEALEGRLKADLDEDPGTFGVQANLGLLLERMGRMGEAEAYYRRAFEGRLRVLGPSHPDTLDSEQSLGSALYSLGRLEEAASLFEDVLEGRRTVQGGDQLQTLLVESNLGFWRQFQGRFEEAERHHRRALEGRRKVLGETHSLTQMSGNGLAFVLMRQQRYEECEALARRLFEAGTGDSGADPQLVAEARSLLGVALFELGRFEEAEGHLVEAYAELDRKRPGERPSELLEHTAQWLVDLYLAMEWPEQADEWRARAGEFADPPR